MQVEAISHNAQPESFGASVDAISKMLDIEESEGRSLARYMKEIGWAELNPANLVRGPCLVLTPKGHEEIAKLRRPKWQRWFDAHPKTTAFLVAVATSTTIIIASKIIEAIW